MAHRIALTVDLEPDWGVRGTRAYREITPKFLRFLERRGMHATFFVVSDLLDASTEVVSAVAERNEVGSHGRSHRVLDCLSSDEVRRELEESRERLEAVGVSVRGFRAPFFRRRQGLSGLVSRAGYSYDASMGSVVPGPINGRLHVLDCPFRCGDIYEFPTSAMCGGLVPLSLTWLRLLAPLSLRQLPKSASLVYLHLHEFLPPETASHLPITLRRVLTRNCGRNAWRILDAALAALGGEFTTCAAILEAKRQERGEKGEANG